MITSSQNKRVARAARLKKRAMREKDRLFLVEGTQGVAEAFASGAPVREVFVSPDAEERLEGVVEASRNAGVPLQRVSAQVMAHLTSTVTPQGVVAVSGFVDRPIQALDPSGFVPVLIEVRDPGNAGTIVRSADAAGAAGVVFTEASVDLYNPKTVRATAGSVFHLPVIRAVSAEEAVRRLREGGFGVLAAAADGDRSIYQTDLARPTAVLFGNEAWGLRPEARSLADATVRVPIAGKAESLNLAAAATLVLFEAARQRAAPGDAALAGVVAGAAHDIRSPLTAMKAFSSTLASRWPDLTDDQRRVMTEGIAHDAVRMEHVLSQLVDAARIEAGTLELAPVPVDLVGAIRSLREELGRWGGADLVVSGEPTTAVVDPKRLSVMVMAMIEAAEWQGEEGPVEVRVVASDPPAVSVSRRGTALAPSDLPSLFAPRAPGSGGGPKIGLSVARRLARAHGGSLEAAVAEDRLTFTLTLPSRALPQER